MEETTWEQRHHALTHILTHHTTTPSLHAQFFIATQIPCYLDWEYPPILCPKHHEFRWALSLFMKRVSVKKASWRSKCPYQLPQPLVLAKGVEEPKWGEEDKIQYVKKRLRRKRLIVNLHLHQHLKAKLHIAIRRRIRVKMKMSKESKGGEEVIEPWTDCVEDFGGGVVGVGRVDAWCHCVREGELVG
ncbi:unnamed protein product [Lactuca saligna]|uniref:Uncharacterized protein n=1 Tax=Lactuca saligna TaxID=75948 RepID=A0AA35YT03_LACSI|nr:unnamed protein product [Lactuca saligna]